MSTEANMLEDLGWAGLVVAFFLFSGRFVAFADRLMPERDRRPLGDTLSEQADQEEVRA
jgi:hypothetical protein